MVCSQVCRGDTETDGEGDCILAPRGANENKKKRPKKGIEPNETGKLFRKKNDIRGSTESGRAKSTHPLFTPRPIHLAALARFDAP